MVEQKLKSKSKNNPRGNEIIGSDEEEQIEETPKINHNLMFKTAICSIVMLVVTFCLFCYFAVSFFSQLLSAIFQSSGDDHKVFQQTKAHNFLVALSLVPALWLGAFQLHILRLVQNQGADQIYSVICSGRYLQVPISCFVAGTYILGAVLFFVYSLTIQDWEDKEDEWRSKALVYIPAGVLGALFLLQMRSLMQSFEDPYQSERASLLSCSRRRSAYQGTSFQQPQQYSIQQPQVELTVRREPENPQFAYYTDTDQEIEDEAFLNKNGSSQPEKRNKSVVVSLKDMIGQYDIANDLTLKSPINWDSSDDEEK